MQNEDTRRFNVFSFIFFAFLSAFLVAANGIYETDCTSYIATCLEQTGSLKNTLEDQTVINSICF